jgi:hypothetical protein
VNGGDSVLGHLGRREGNLYESKHLVYAIDAHPQSNWKNGAVVVEIDDGWGKTKNRSVTLSCLASGLGGVLRMITRLLL